MHLLAECLSKLMLRSSYILPGALHTLKQLQHLTATKVLLVGASPNAPDFTSMSLNASRIIQVCLRKAPKVELS